MRSTLCRLFALLALIGLAGPAHAAPVPDGGKGGDALAAARKALDETGDMNYQGRTLADVMADIKTKTQVDVILDPSLVNFGIDTTQPMVTVTVKQVKLRDALKTLLAPYNLRFGLVREGIFISTEEGLTLRQLRQRVNVDCDAIPFATTMKQLGADTGANLVLDPRLGEKATRAVTLKLDDVPLETAVRLLAEVADLRAVRMNNVLFITTPERADKLRPDADAPTQPTPPNPFFPINPAPGIGIGPVPFALPAPVPQAIPAPPPPVEKK